MTDTAKVQSPPRSLSEKLLGPARPLVARPARWLKRRLERALHPRRRRAAEARLARLGPVRSVLVMCYGNICRSPYAAAVLGNLVTERQLPVRVTQGGFFGPNRPANDRGKSVAEGRQVNLEQHRSRLATREDASGTDLIVVMEQWQAARMITELGAPAERLLVLGDLDPQPVESRTIPDPYGFDIPFFEKTYDRLDRCLLALVRAIT